MKLSTLSNASFSSHKSQQQISIKKIKTIQQLKYITPTKNITHQQPIIKTTRSKSTDTKILVTYKHFPSTNNNQNNQSKQRIKSKQHKQHLQHKQQSINTTPTSIIKQNNIYTTKRNKQTITNLAPPINYINNQFIQTPQKSPFNKNCFNKNNHQKLINNNQLTNSAPLTNRASLTNRAILTVDQIKKNKLIQQQQTNTKKISKSLSNSLQKYHFPTSTKKSTALSPLQISSTIKPFISTTQQANTSRSIQPTHYTSVKLFMSSKFKKGIKQKIPINILAMPQSIHQKQTTDSVLSTSCVKNLNFQQTILLNQHQSTQFQWISNFNDKNMKIK